MTTRRKHKEMSTNPTNPSEGDGLEPENKLQLSFLLRPPIRKEEASAAATRIHEVINTAYNVYTSEGVKSLREFISNQKLGDNCSDSGAGGSLTAKDNENDKEAKISGDPRPYQIAMAEIVKEQNTIVQLNTGLGKTLIAIMTIKNFAHDFKSVNSKGHAKQTWFLVPSVALAVQQSNTLRVNLPYSISTVCHTGEDEKLLSTKVADCFFLIFSLFIHKNSIYLQNSC